MTSKSAITLCSLALAAAVAAPAAAHERHHDHHTAAPVAAAGKSAVKLPDVRLSDQHGAAKYLLTDVIGDRIVVVDFVYTSCATVCPVVSGILAAVQDELGDRLGNDVRLVSITVDPARDTPKRLKDYAAKFRAKPGWVWLTGTAGPIAEALRGFGTYTPNFEDHPSVVMVGDARTGEWTRYYGFASPRQLIERIDELAAARAAVKTAGRG